MVLYREAPGQDSYGDEDTLPARVGDVLARAARFLAFPTVS